MANFGKKAVLDSQKSTVGVECLVSVYDTICDEEGKPVRYKVIVQRLQDTVNIKDAEAGKADALPFITNRKEWSCDQDGNAKVNYSHYDFILPDMMDAIKNAAVNCYKTGMSVETSPGFFEDLTIDNYCVKLNIGFNFAMKEAYFYRIRSGVNKDSLAKDIKYNLRHMPKAGRELTAAILNGHKTVTDIAARVYRDSLKLGKGHHEHDNAATVADEIRGIVKGD